MIRYVTAAPKTGSSYIVGCIVLAQAAEFRLNVNYRLYPPWWNQECGKDWDLHTGFGEYIASADERVSKGGGIYKGHFWATQKNLGVLESEDNHYVVILRSPADTLTAQFCSVMAEPKEAKYNPIYPIDHTKFSTVDEGIHSLIKDGYLKHLLMYLMDWIDNLDPEKGRLVLFERFIEDPMASLAEINKWTGVELKADAVGYHVKGIEKFYRKDDDIDCRIYPKGWTGYSGVWRRYFSRSNKRAFESVYHSIFAGHPGSLALNGIYECGFDYREGQQSD